MADNKDPNDPLDDLLPPEQPGLITPPSASLAAAGTGINASLARLRLLLRSVEQRQQESQRRFNFLRQQFRRIPTLAVNGHLNVETYLAAVAESRRRMSNLEQELQDLEELRTRVQKEIHAFDLTLRIQQTQTDLAHLREQARWDSRPELADEILRLDVLAQELVLEAGRSITSAEPPVNLEPPTR